MSSQHRPTATYLRQTIFYTDKDLTNLSSRRSGTPVERCNPSLWRRRRRQTVHNVVMHFYGGSFVEARDYRSSVSISPPGALVPSVGSCSALINTYYAAPELETIEGVGHNSEITTGDIAKSTTVGSSDEQSPQPGESHQTHNRLNSSSWKLARGAVLGIGAGIVMYLAWSRSARR
jgi:hypothetical protein